MPDPPPTTHPAPTSADLSNPQPHISAPSQFEEAKSIDLNPAFDIKTPEAGTRIPEAGDVSSEPSGAIAPKPKLETGMSATSGPMGDHMAEVWRDSDVGVREGRPVDVEGRVEAVAEGGAEGGKF